jgi:hypothetical protein
MVVGISPLRAGFLPPGSSEHGGGGLAVSFWGPWALPFPISAPCLARCEHSQGQDGRGREGGGSFFVEFEPREFRHMTPRSRSRPLLREGRL